MEPTEFKKLKQQEQVRSRPNSVVKRERKRMSSSCSSSASKNKSQHHTAPGTNAARERSRVKTLRMAFMDLQRSLPAVPRDTKLSKLDVLLLATTYIAHLTKTLSCLPAETSCDQPTDHGDLTQPQVRQQTVDRPLPVHAVRGRRSVHRADFEYKILSDKGSGKPGRSVAGCVGRVPGVLPCSAQQSALGRQAEHSGHGDRCQTISCLRVDGLLHPVKKWPMRTRLYAGIMASTQEMSKAMCSGTHLY